MTTKIQYVGKKPFAVDNVAGSRVTWNGNGDIKEVADECVATLLGYPDQWALAEGASIPSDQENKVAAPTKDLTKMNAKQLRDYAKKEHNAKFKIGMTLVELRKEVEALELARADTEFDKK